MGESSNGVEHANTWPYEQRLEFSSKVLLNGLNVIFLIFVWRIVIIADLPGEYKVKGKVQVKIRKDSKIFRFVFAKITYKKQEIFWRQCKVLLMLLQKHSTYICLHEFVIAGRNV